jgi:hypothetical protein
MPVGDAEDLLRLGAPLWLLLVVGAMGVMGGLSLWNRLGPHYGVRGQPVEKNATVLTLALLVAMIAGMLAWSWLT